VNTRQVCGAEGVALPVVAAGEVSLKQVEDAIVFRRVIKNLVAHPGAHYGGNALPVILMRVIDANDVARALDQEPVLTCGTVEQVAEKLRCARFVPSAEADSDT
jgi:hypothetical protein